jgi:hypothetical protein
MRSSRVQSVSSYAKDDAIKRSLRQMQANRMITYASPTTDFNYKQVFLCTHALETRKNEIGKDFCNAMLKITMPGYQLSTRRVECMSEHVDAAFKNFYLAVKDFVDVPEQQSLKVDALFCADMDDDRRGRLAQTRTQTKGKSNRFVKPAFVKPACILGEMQVCKQDFGIRLMSYACKILGGCVVDLKKGIIPLPVYATGFCMWGNDRLIQGPLRINSNDLDANKATKFSEIVYSNVFLGKRLNVLLSDNRKSLDEKLQKGQNELKRKVIRFFKGYDSFGLSRNYFLDNENLRELLRDSENAFQEFLGEGNPMVALLKKKYQSLMQDKNFQRLIQDWRFRGLIQNKGFLDLVLGENFRSLILSDDDQTLDKKKVLLENYLFGTLTFEEKKVYLWLEFLSFAHLMTEEKKDESLACLHACISDVYTAEEVDVAINVFNSAYDVIRLNFEGGVTMEEIKEKYPDVYGIAEWQAEAENREILSNVNMIEAAVDGLRASDNLHIFKNLVHGFVAKIEPKIRRKVYKELKNRDVIQVPEIINVLEQEISNQESVEMRNQRRDALAKARRFLLEDVVAWIDDLTSTVGQLEKALAPEGVTQEDLDRLASLEEKLQDYDSFKRDWQEVLDSLQQYCEDEENADAQYLVSQMQGKMILGDLEIRQQAALEGLDEKRQLISERIDRQRILAQRKRRSGPSSTSVSPIVRPPLEAVVASPRPFTEYHQSFSVGIPCDPIPEVSDAPMIQQAAPEQDLNPASIPLETFEHSQSVPVSKKKKKLTKAGTGATHQTSSQGK